MLAPRNIRWDITADVVVIGYGLAGAAAAITARQKGSSVVILEKQNRDSHCSYSSISLGLFICPTSIDKAVDYMKAMSQLHETVFWTEMDTINAWAEYAVQNKQWLESLGGQVKFFLKAAEHPELPGSDSIEIWQFAGSGLRMMQFMYNQVKSHKIDTLYETRAQRLLTNENGDVIGVRASSLRGDDINIKALKAVILCSGGFEENEEMKLQYLRIYPAYFAGSTASTGDGIKMAQEVGADLWHMSCCSARLVAKFPDFPIAFLIDFRGKRASKKPTASFIIVNKYGQRYMSENFKGHAGLYQLTFFDSNRLEYPAVPSYLIFDQRRMTRSPLAVRMGGAPGPHQLYRWSLDNRAELERGWILFGETVSELASRIGVSPATLEQTIQLWNKSCEEGKDQQFSRNPTDMVPLNNPPFYAMRLYPGGPNTQGGPKRNSRAQVVNSFNESIGGLYAAGECGSVYGLLYPGPGGNLAECIAFGRIAGENAAMERTKA